MALHYSYAYTIACTFFTGERVMTYDSANLNYTEFPIDFNTGSESLWCGGRCCVFKFLDLVHEVLRN